MGLPIVENLSGLSGNIFSLSRIPQLHFNKKSKNWSSYINIPQFPRYPPVSEMRSPDLLKRPFELHPHMKRCCAIFQDFTQQ